MVDIWLPSGELMVDEWIILNDFDEWLTTDRLG